MEDLLDNAPCGFLTTDDAGVVLQVNTTLCRMLELQPNQLQGRLLSELLTPGARIFHATHVIPLVRMQGEVQEVMLGLLNGRGEELPVLCSATRRDRDQWVMDYVFLTARERRDFEDELVEARRKAETAVDARERFLATVSHELRTPLNAVIGFADLLHSGYSGTLTDEQSQQAGYILDAGRYLGTLVEDILGFTHMGSALPQLHPARVPVQRLMERAERLMAAELVRKDIRFEGDAVEQEIAVWADPDRAQQILVNLLGNGIKFTDAGGIVRWECAVRGSRVDLRVTDSGPGIAADDQRRIFQPFVQVGRDRPGSSYRGLGLGLAISRELALAMEGEITVRSKPGSGSTFTLTLPLAPPAAQE